MKKLRYLLILLSILSCKEKQVGLTSDVIVARAIENACQGNCAISMVEFDFRGRHYISYRQNGKYRLERITDDSTGVIRDVLHNNGFERYKNDSLVQLPDSIKVKYASSVNGVHYFAQLPFGLEAPAVRTKLLGESVVKGEKYYEIEVTFEQEEGGKDHEDVFVYWIHQISFTVDYFAYLYFTDEGGIRFREAINPRVVGGIRFMDYNNYKTNDLTFPLKQLDSLYELGALQLLSKIETENVSVTPVVDSQF